MLYIFPAQVISLMNESTSINTFLFATTIQISEIFHTLSKYLSMLNEGIRWIYKSYKFMHVSVFVPSKYDTRGLGRGSGG